MRNGVKALPLMLGLFLIGASSDVPRPAREGTSSKLLRATFAAGCFWCAEAAFEPVPGVVSVTSGYAGGTVPNPTYEQVSSGHTGHAESVQVLYDPARTSYEKLLDVFWHNVDPTTTDRQFCDSGHQYRSAIFFENAEQQSAALASKKQIEEAKHFKDGVKTEIVPLNRFWPAEEHHQDYYKKNPIQYNAYRQGCRRDRRLHEVWGAEAGSHE